ncbi:Astacin-like metalloendopeptidase [Strongyloides ratti]|uniref:Metalloendopeptidase n=1 Tax=Strongyloides ratti TaxID=34506 RepID=A0A090LKI3_STRRB|nr:Astacin-like metalloendopeptidase [Strongyloides ratti]CEF70322.2 Astacin-like metalloendopeptidase [Strongyloides ratti]
MIFFIMLIIFFKIINGIILTNISFDNYYDNKRQKKAILRDESKIWREKEIQYYVHPALDHTLIKVALSRISKETCFFFRYETRYKNSLFVYLPGKYYETNLGRGREIPHKIFVPKYLQDIGKVIRETMRALGIEYEHNRPDRNMFVVIFFDSIKPDFLEYFKKKSFDETRTYGIEYNYRSIMHFSPHEYSKRFRKALFSKDRLMESSIGLSKYLTFGDAKLLNKKYCSFPQIFYPNCFNRGYQHPRSPNTCKCLPFFIGNRCEGIMQNGHSCSQNNFYTVRPQESITYLNVGGKCFYLIRSNSGKKIKIKIKFFNVDPYYNIKCTVGNSVEIRIKSLFVDGILFCPSRGQLDFISTRDMVAIISNFPPSNIQLKVTYSEA